jgi:hypothetical protein
MSKNLSREQEVVPLKSEPQEGIASAAIHQPDASPPSKASRISHFWNLARRRRTTWLAAIACLVGLGSLMLPKAADRPRMGVIQYSSDDPNAQVILEKDGQDIPLEQGTKFTTTLEPGHYELRLVGHTQGLKLQPRFINLDPGGLGIVTVRRESK